MATFYWVGGTGNWNDPTNHWAPTSGGTPAAGNIPGLSDNAIFDANSGTGTCTVVGTSPNCATLNTTGSTLLTFSVAVNGLTVSGLLTLTGGTGLNRMFVTGATLGTASTISAGSVSLTNVDFMDITGAGAATWSGTSIGDCQGNSGITFTTAATQTWQGNLGGNWSDVTKWTSRVPLPQDNVIFASAFTPGQIVTTDLPRLGKNIDWSGCTGTNLPVMRGQTSMTSSWYGNLTFKSLMSTSSQAGNAWQSRGRGTITFTPNQVTVQPGLTVYAPGGTHTLAGPYAQSNISGVNIGTYNTGNFNVTIGSQWVIGAGAVCNFGTSTFTFTNSTSAINVMTVAATATITAEQAAFVIGSASTFVRTFAGGGKRFGTLTYVVAGSTGDLKVTGNNYFDTINFYDVNNTRGLRFDPGGVNTIRNRVISTSAAIMTVNSSTLGTQTVLRSVRPWYMGAHSTFVSNNIGLILADGAEMDYINTRDIVGQPIPNTFMSFCY